MDIVTKRVKVYYRLANRQAVSSCWQWESRVIASREILFRVLWLYRSVHKYRLRVFFSSSVAGLDLMLVRENEGLKSNSIPVEQLVHEWWTTNPSNSYIEIRQFESELRSRESIGILEPSTVEEQDGHGKMRKTLSEGSLDMLDRRRLEIELGVPGDHDILYTFSLPTSPAQTIAWLNLLNREHHEELQPKLVNS
jgi:hypothetical protein